MCLECVQLVFSFCLDPKMKIQRPLWALALLWLVWGVLWPVGAIESLCLEGL